MLTQPASMSQNRIPNLDQVGWRIRIFPHRASSVSKMSPSSEMSRPAAAGSDPEDLGRKRFQMTAHKPWSYSKLVEARSRLCRSRFLQASTESFYKTVQNLQYIRTFARLRAKHLQNFALLWEHHIFFLDFGQIVAEFWLQSVIFRRDVHIVLSEFREMTDYCQRSAN